MQRILTAIVFSSLVVVVLPVTTEAQVPVETRSATSDSVSPQAGMRQPAVGNVSSPQVDLYSQLQVLQDEVRSLRGVVEELQYQLNQSRQRQMDDYMDLDRRISRLQGGTAAGNAPENTGNKNAAATVSAESGGSPVPSSGTGSSATPPPASDAEVAQYNLAYTLLKERKVSEAATAFQNYVLQYPSGRYTANAHYWLGEISLLQNNLEEARQSFTVVVENFPNDRKTPDATFKLGKVYHMLGDNERARKLLNQVASGNSSAARLAQDYLRDNL